MHLTRLAPSAVLLGLVACAEPPTTGVDEAEVIGGTPTPAGMYPTIGALYDLQQRSFFCTGTLIAPDAVLTAAHCIEPGSAPAFTFAHDTRGQVTALAGRSAVVHPSFQLDRQLGSGPQTYFDIAVVTLMQPVTTVRPTLLPSAAEVAMLTVGRELELVGYGQTRDGDPGSGAVKHHGRAPIVAVGATELQISQPGSIQNCYGDSGGPALVDLGGGHRVVGVVSRGATDSPRCNEGGLDTRVDAYLAWIKQQAPAACVSDDASCNGAAPPPPSPDDPPAPQPEPDPEEPGGAPDPAGGADRADVITGGCAAGGADRSALGLALGLVAGAFAVRRRRRTAAA